VVSEISFAQLPVCKFQNICDVIARTLKMKTRKETNLKFYKIMAVPVIL
jgi:hypothetical protein